MRGLIRCSEIWRGIGRYREIEEDIGDVGDAEKTQGGIVRYNQI